MDIINKKEISGIQILRGLASLAVVLCHASFALTAYPALSGFLMNGQLGIHIFFFISGYIVIYSLLKNKYSVKYFFHFLAKRSIRIDPMYILTIFLTLASFWVFSFFPTFKGKAIPFIFQQFAAHLIYIVPFTKWPFYNHVFWTLCIEFQFYILIGTLYFVVNKWPFKAIFIIAFSLCCFINVPNSYYLLINYAPIFAMGIALIEYQMTKKNIYAICFIVCGILTYLHFDLLTLALILASAAVVVLNKKKYLILIFFGNISYSLYLIHPLVLLYLNGITRRFLPHLLSYQLIVLMMQLIFSIAVAYLFYFLIEKPSIKLSKKIKISS
ncbi:acyltransferase [Pedobacter miscanthi]|uniref:acyltransferase family protein n=1 Tax=Pedobacter miscanthi TaxID=2259170 RepID=UPI00292E07B6|nr:acyltransferase [Pedobacter miscanthi]